MGTTKATLIGYLRDRLSSTVDDGLLTEDSLANDVNFGLAAFADERDWPWLNALQTIAVSSGDNLVDDLPAGITHIHSLSVNGAPLQEVNYDDFLTSSTTSGVGCPRLYTQVGDNIYLSPTPDQAYTLSLFYQHEERVLSADGDQTYAPTRYASLITTYAAIYSAVRTRDTNNIAALYQLRKDELVRVYDAMRLSDVGPRIEVRKDMTL